MSENNRNQKSVRLKLGAFSTLATIMVLLVLIAVNLVVSNFNLFYDLTPDRFYSISDKSKEVLDEIDEEITLYTLYKTGDEVALYQQYVESYSVYPNIKIVNVDPYIRADFVSRYAAEGETVPVNSIIVECNDRFKVIEPSMMYTLGVDPLTGSETIDTVTLEREVTNAIRSVALGLSYNVYAIKGHNEPELSQSYIQELNGSDFVIKDLELPASTEIPEDADAIIITTPLRDYSDLETDIVSSYLKNGGKALFFLDFTGEAYPNLKNLINFYGIDYQENIVLEEDSRYIIPMDDGSLNPFYFVPQYVSHPITDPISNLDYRVMLASARPLNETDVKRQGLTIEPFLVSSETTYLKDITNSETTTISREPGDVTGPFTLAYAVTDMELTPSNPTRIAFMGTSSVLADELNNGTNSALIINMLSWACGRNTNVYIAPKVITSALLNITNIGVVYRIAVQSMVIVPAVILIAGTVVWLRRRNK
jgi:ABC-type uncharacterized transport system involved in gliding motility auxiliary subunit